MFLFFFYVDVVVFKQNKQRKIAYYCVISFADGKFYMSTALKQMPQKLFRKFPEDVNTLCYWERVSLLCPFTSSNSVEINRKNSLLNIQLLLCVNTANPRSQLFFKRKLHIWMHWRKSLWDCGLSVRIAREAYMLMFCVQGELCWLWTINPPPNHWK